MVTKFAKNKGLVEIQVLQLNKNKNSTSNSNGALLKITFTMA